ncbi:hypothetical protein [Pseudobacillus wudalianchiensis]|nr:hypothetical protein [Bacillus wudalianchiensis]
MSLTDFLTVIFAFSQLLDGLPSFTQQDAHKYKIKCTNKIPFDEKDLVYLIADLYWVFKDFDNRIPKILTSNFCQEPTRDVRKKRKKFEERILSSEKLRFIINAYEELRLEHFICEMKAPRNVKIYDRQALNFIKENYLTKGELKRQYQLVESEYDFLMKSGAFKDCYFNNGNASYFFKKRINRRIQTFLKEKADAVTVAEAAMLLGVNVNRVSSLVKNGILNYSSYMGYSKWLSKESIQQLFVSLNAEEIKDVENKVSFRRSFEMFATSGLNVVELIHFIRRDHLKAYTKTMPYKLFDLYFEVDDLLKKIKEKRILTKGLSLSEAAAKLNCGERTVMKMVEVGLLSSPAVEKIHSSSFAYRFDLTEIDRFQKNFYMVDQLVKEFKVTPTLISNAIYRGSLKNYLAGKCRKVIVNKKEFEEYLKKQKRAVS